MTDGIIQQVFKFYYGHNDRPIIKKECNDCKYAREIVMNELIEKIDKTFGNTQFDLSERAIKRLLIGDNKE